MSEAVASAFISLGPGKLATVPDAGGGSGWVVCSHGRTRCPPAHVGSPQ